MINSTYYDWFIKPILFQLYPENAHELVKDAFQIVDKIPFGMRLLESFTCFEHPKLNTNIANILFKNPVGLGAGFDKTGELYPFLSKLGFGFIEIGTITGEAQSGNPKPRIFRYVKESALVNRMGFNNQGSELAQKILDTYSKTIPIGINAGKTKLVTIEKTVDDYVKTFKLLSKYGDYAVINISSPNTPGLRGFQEKNSFIELINGIKQGLGGQFIIPTFVKLAPDLEDSAIEELLDIILDLSLSGVILTNTSINPELLKGNSHIETGGISGKPLRQRSTHIIRLAFKRLKNRIPIIGIGGIDDGESALEKIQAGASLVQVYTGYVYKGPSLVKEILQYLVEYMDKNNIKQISDLIGTGH